MIPCVAVVGQVVANRLEAVLVSSPGDGVGDSLPSVRVGAGPHVVTRFRHVPGIGDAFLSNVDAIACLVPEIW